MLKYTDTKVVFQEIPDEITLAINISGCPCACVGCHSSYLAEDIGTPLTEVVIEQLITQYEHASCIAFMGGDRAPSEVSHLAAHLKGVAPHLMVGWYSGRDELSKEVDTKYFDYIKIGSYQEDKGALNCPTTNQRLYHIVEEEWVDITHKLIDHKKAML